MKLAALILAAGYSSRMGGFKPLMTLGGRSLLAHCAEVLDAVPLARVVVVTGHRHREVTEEGRRLGLDCLENPHHDQGMFSSIVAGLRRLGAVDGVLLLPVDIPLVRPATVIALAAAFDGATTIIPHFRGMPGHPPLLAGPLIPKILTDDGRGGLRRLLAQLPRSEVLTLPVWDQGILLDADTPEDWIRLSKRFERLAMGERDEVLELARLKIPEKGQAHGLAVAAVAERLGRELNNHGLFFDLNLLVHGAILHDIAKGHPHHEATGAAWLRTWGLTDLAEIVAGHRHAEILPDGKIGEKEVLALADKLVRGRERVSVARRFQEKLEIYRDDQEACRAIGERLEKALALQRLVESICCQTIEAILDQGAER